MSKLGLLICNAEVSKPRYVRVNTLKMDVDSALLELGQQNMVPFAIILNIGGL
jgi:hypothetical protein